MSTSLQEVLALVFQMPGLQAFYQNAFKIQTQIDGQRKLEDCGEFRHVCDASESEKQHSP